MSIQKLTESKIYREIFNRLPSDLRMDADWYFDASKSRRSKEEQKLMSEWVETTTKLKFLRQNLARAANRGADSKEVKVKLDYVYEIGEKQGWKCAASGVDLEFTRGGSNWGGKWCNPKSCTIDRIDNQKGYIPGNIQLITWESNCLRGNIDWDDFVNLCKQIAKNYK
jgi:hypothetical protein